LPAIAWSQRVVSTGTFAPQSVRRRSSDTSRAGVLATFAISGASDSYCSIGSVSNPTYTSGALSFSSHAASCSSRPRIGLSWYVRPVSSIGAASGASSSVMLQAQSRL
jgi:hypothetical protein